jgi:hypothetical protein
MPKTRKVAFKKATKTPTLPKVKAKKGQLLLQHGRDEDGEVGTVLAHGEGCSKNDAWLLHSAMFDKRCSLNLMMIPIWEPSFMEELEKRGYDPKTAMFSIEKKVT